MNTTDWIYEQRRRLRENENRKDIYFTSNRDIETY